MLIGVPAPTLEDQLHGIQRLLLHHWSLRSLGSNQQSGSSFQAENQRLSGHWHLLHDRFYVLCTSYNIWMHSFWSCSILLWQQLHHYFHWLKSIISWDHEAHRIDFHLVWEKVQTWVILYCDTSHPFPLSKFHHLMDI